MDVQTEKQGSGSDGTNETKQGGEYAVKQSGKREGPGSASDIRATLRILPKSNSTQAPPHALLLMSAHASASLVGVTLVAAMPALVAVLALAFTFAISTDHAQRVAEHGVWGCRMVLSGGHIRP